MLDESALRGETERSLGVDFEQKRKEGLTRLGLKKAASLFGASFFGVIVELSG